MINFVLFFLLCFVSADALNPRVIPIFIIYTCLHVRSGFIFILFLTHVNRVDRVSNCVICKERSESETRWSVGGFWGVKFMTAHLSIRIKDKERAFPLSVAKQCTTTFRNRSFFYVSVTPTARWAVSAIGTGEMAR